MAVTIQSVRKVGASSWRVAWTSDVADAVFDVYLNGALVSRQLANSIVVSGDYIDTRLLEIVDDGSAPQYAGGNRSELSFDGDVNADRYDIEHNPSGAGWTKIAELPARGGREALRTYPLNDADDHEFRVTPRRVDGTAGTQAVASGHSVRHPDVPVVSMSYAAGTGIVTIS